MPATALTILDSPSLHKPRLVLAFSGWMNGGEISTGTADMLLESGPVQPLADIAPDPFYIYNFPASMEVAGLFRPHGRIEGGVIQSYEPPENRFFYDVNRRLVIMSGQEPHLHWKAFSDCIFEVVAHCEIEEIFFVGSVGGVVPHTREPRLFSSMSDAAMKPALEECGLRFTDYEGPVSLVSYMMTRAADHGCRMATVVAEVPAYVQGRNPKSLVAVARKIAAMLDIALDVEPLRAEIGAWEKRLTEVIADRPDLVKHIRKLEADYDNEVFEQMGDLKDWLQSQGIRID